MIDLIYLILLLILCAGVGRTLLTSLSFRFSNPVEELVFALAGGLGLLGYGVFLLGLAGWLYVEVLYGFLLVGLAVFIVPATKLIIELSRWSQRREALQTGGRAIFPVFLLGVLVVVLSVCVLKSFVPPTGNDPLAYSLDLPKRFLRYHRISYLPYMATSVFPLLMQMFYVLGLALRSTALAQLLHCSMGILTGLSVYCLARKWLDVRFALIGAIVFITVPGIFHQMPVAQNDVALTYFLFLALYSIWKWVETSEFKWAALAGSFAGFALSIKLIALLGCGAALIVLFAFSGRLSLSKKGLALALFGLLTLTFSFMWYTRAFYHTGNPVYPYFPDFFGGIGRDYDMAKQGLGKGVMDFILSPWNITVRPSQFGGRGNQFGPIFLLLLPALVLLKRPRNRPALFFIVYSIVYFTGWFLGAQNLRFLFPILPAICILLAFSFQLLESQRLTIFQGVSRLILVVCLLLNTAIVVVYLRGELRVALGLESHETFLSKAERSYPIASYVNANLPEDALILSDEIRAFYFDRELVRFDRTFKRLENLDDIPAEQFVTFLKEKGFSHVLLIKGSKHRGGDSKREDLYSLLHKQELIQDRFEEVKRIDFVYPDGSSLGYILLRIK